MIFTAAAMIFGAVALKDHFVKELNKTNNQDFPRSPNYQGSTAPPGQEDLENESRFTTASSAGVLAYPLDIDPEQDHLEIDEFLYRRPGSGTPPAGEWGVTQAFQRMNASGPDASTASTRAYSGTIVLPMPKASDSNAADWGKSEMTGDQMMAANVAGAALGMGQEGRDNQQMLELAQGGNLGRTSDLASGGGQGGQGGARTSRTGSNFFSNSAIAWAGKQASGMIGVETDHLLARTRGQVLNPNAELLFQGPSLREFQFAWMMVARSSREGDMIRKIIKKFKRGMSPIFNNTALMETPSIWQLRYMRGRSAMVTVNMFKQMALTEFAVDYAPDGHWAAYGDSQPVSVRLKMTFKELRPIYSVDQEEADSRSVGY